MRTTALLLRERAPQLSVSILAADLLRGVDQAGGEPRLVRPRPRHRRDRHRYERQPQPDRGQQRGAEHVRQVSRGFTGQLRADTTVERCEVATVVQQVSRLVRPELEGRARLSMAGSAVEGKAPRLGQIAEGDRPWIRNIDRQGRLASRFKADEYLPQGGGYPTRMRPRR